MERDEEERKMKKNKKIKVLHVSSYENTKRSMPKYNAFQTGTGITASCKYPSRGKRKKELRKEIEKEM